MPIKIDPNLYAATAQKANQDASAIANPIAATNPRGKLYRAGQIATVAGEGLDEGSTLANLSTGRFKEENGLLSNNPVQNATIKTGLTAAKLYAMKKLADHGHDKLAGALGLVSAAFPIGAGIYNLSIHNFKR